MNLTQVLGEQYYALISNDVRTYYHTSKAKVSPNTFDLYDRLRDLQEVLGIDRFADLATYFFQTRVSPL